MSEAQAVVAAVVRKVLTRAEKIEAAVAKIAVLEAQVKTLREEEAKEQALLSVDKGTEVTFDVGRAETRRTVSGVVLAAYDAEGKRKVKVLVGEGAEAELFEVLVTNLLDAKVEVAEEVGTDADPLATIN